MFNSTKISAIFIAVVLVAGTISAISPSFMLGAQAQQDYRETDNRYNIYEPEPEYPIQYAENENNSYEPSYEKETYETPSYENNHYETPSYGNNNYEPREYSSYQQDYKPKYQSYEKDNYKSKKDDNSKSVSINKINCINNNVNINGDNTGNISIGNKGQGYSGGYSSTGSGSGYGSGEGYDGKQGKDFDCIINNNNNNIAGGDNQTTAKATLDVSKIVTCTYRVGGLAPETACAMLEEQITENQFLIEVIDDNPIPSQFPGSESGTIVTLGAGNYIVSETPDVASIQLDIDFLENEFEDLAGDGTEYEITGPFPSFTGDCTDVNPNIPQSTEATGTIAAGESQTCNVINHFTITALEGAVGEP
jgi:hypothetical protein